jgi:hypothetical protein
LSTVTTPYYRNNLQIDFELTKVTPSMLGRRRHASRTTAFGKGGPTVAEWHRETGEITFCWIILGAGRLVIYLMALKTSANFWTTKDQPLSSFRA